MSWWVAGAVVGSALIGSSSARSAAGTQAESTAAGIGENARQYDITRSDFAPFREAGKQALGKLQTEMDAPTTSADVMSDPGYRFGLEQGQQALERKIAATGGRVSGAALKAASEYGTNYATTGFNAAYQRRQDRLNRLAALAGIGQSATGSSAAAGAATAGANANLLTAQGNASGASQLAQGSIWGNTANSLGAVAQKWAARPQTTPLVNSWEIPMQPGGGS